MSSATDQRILDDPTLRSEVADRQRAADDAVRNASAPPEHVDGRGIVICGGGGRYLPCAWVEIQMLRALGCQLPIELWHLAGEIPDYFKEILLGVDVDVVNASDLLQDKPARTLRGWELKAYAILHCRFREVLLLDADNVPIRNPTYLFDSSEFLRTGAVFWPDYRCLSPNRAIWEICGVEYKNEPEFETGQILVDKIRHWLPLSLAMHYNEHSDFYYQHIHGDKETFHMAFRRLEVEYAMPVHPIYPLAGTMCQHDFNGERVFQHRNMAKWSLFGGNRRIGGFELENECLKFLDELRSIWRPREHGVLIFDIQHASPEEREIARTLCSGIWTYRRVGYDERILSFSLDGYVGEGAAGCEVFWHIENDVAGRFELTVSSQSSATCHLLFDGNGWRGNWLIGECMPVELVKKETDASWSMGGTTVRVHSS